MATDSDLQPPLALAVALAAEENMPSLELAQTVAAYLPESVVAGLLANPEFPAEPTLFDAIVMQTDITGFTPLCEMLASQGREGTEHVTDLINDFFNKALVFVREAGGVIAKFGGDAFTAFFTLPPQKDAIEIRETVMRQTLDCAFNLQRMVLNYEELRLKVENDTEYVFRLYPKVGLGVGKILGFPVGQSGQQQDFYYTGPAINQAVEAEHAASRGEVIAHPGFMEFTSSVQSYLLWENTGPAGFHLKDWLAPPAPKVPPLYNLGRFNPVERKNLVGRIAAYLPPTIFERLKLGYLHLPGEHRRVVSLFVHFEGLDWLGDPAAPANFQSFYLEIQASVAGFKGHLNRITSGDKGDLLHIIFGAPLTYKDDEEQAARCALALQRIAHNRPFITQQRIGLSSGLVFAGEIGSLDRHEYTVIGDTVNLSARLMQTAAPWTVVADGLTAARLRHLFEIGSAVPTLLKGKKKPVDVCEVKQPLAILEAAAALAPLHGREKELAQVAHIQQQARSGQTWTVLVSGEAGIGKSLLLDYVVSTWLFTFQGYVCQTRLLSYEQGAFRLWAKWLGNLTGFDPKAPVDEQTENLTRFVAKIVPDLVEFTPLLAEFFDLPLPANWLTALDPTIRRRRLVELVSQILADLAGQQPLLLACDDLQYADAASLELLAEVLRAVPDIPLLVILASRQQTLTFDQSRCLELPLAGISLEASMQVAWSSLREVAAPDPTATENLVREVGELAGGNPLFVVELINALRDRHSLDNSEVAAPLPSNLETLIMSRLDSLGERLREVLLGAAVVGDYFTPQEVRPVLPGNLANSLDDKRPALLDRLCQLNFLDFADTTTRRVYHFRHALIQQVACNCLPVTRQRDLHEKVAGYFEHTPGYENEDNLLDRLVYHYERSSNDSKAVHYLTQSAARSARLFSGQVASQQYQAAITRFSRARLPDISELAELWLQLGNVQADLVNDFPAAVSSYAEALDRLPAAAYLDRARVETRRCEALLRATKLAEAEQSYHSALNYLEEAKPLPARRLVQAQLAELYSTILFRQAKLEPAVEYAEQGLTLLRGQSGEAEKTRLKLYQSLAAALAALRRINDAGKALSQALRLSRRQHDLMASGQLELRLAILALQRSQYRRAYRLFEKALTLFETIGVPDKLANTLLPGGETLIYLGEFEKAQAWLRRGLELSEKIGAPYFICSGHYLLGRVYKEVGEWEKAMVHYDRSLELAEKHSLWDRVADYLGRKGELWGSRGDFSQAAETIGAALECAETHKLPENIRQCYRLLAEIEVKQGNFRVAADYLQLGGAGSKSANFATTNEAYTAIRVAEWFALVLQTTSEADTRFGNLGDMSCAVSEALRFLESIDSKHLLAKAWRVNGLLAWLQGDPATALAHFNRGLTIARRLYHHTEKAQLLAYRAFLRLNISLNSRSNYLARRDLDEAAALFEKFGAQPELDWLQKLRADYQL